MSADGDRSYSYRLISIQFEQSLSWNHVGWERQLIEIEFNENS